MHSAKAVALLLICSLYLSRADNYEDILGLENDRFMTPDDNLPDALETYQNIQKKSYKRYKLRVCRDWNNRCSPWTNRPIWRCCNGLSCKCNLWGQNCRCSSKIWGR
ncbi:uncharacterized protein LOC128239388 isoform X2 [Mya arenaria]|uniref:uncharacterized protein LOC128239388 isoform X2 n=1 Tax=Mya arenaria TaxID=6604 RepID=UPI0022E97AD2|nr:uncharacterized protein LOC128239388 isoform X2 [Mya arenaria]